MGERDVLTSLSPISKETKNSHTLQLLELSAKTYFTAVSANGEKAVGMRDNDDDMVTFPDKSEALGSVHDTVAVVWPISIVSMISSGQ